MRDRRRLRFGLILMVELSMAGMVAVAGTLPTYAQTGMSVVVLVLRTVDGRVISGAMCTLDSYAWGVALGQETRTIARGETDPNGQVAFDVSEWPRANYVVRFGSTAHTQPETSFTLGKMPVEAMLGEQSGRVFFVVDSTGALHLDSSGGAGQPTYTGGGGADGGVIPIPPLDSAGAPIVFTAVPTGAMPPLPTIPPPAPPLPQGVTFASVAVPPQLAYVPATTATTTVAVSATVRATPTTASVTGTIAPRDSVPGSTPNAPTSDGDLWLLFMVGFVMIIGLLMFERRIFYRALGVNEIGRVTPPTTRQSPGARPIIHQYEDNDE